MPPMEKTQKDQVKVENQPLNARAAQVLADVVETYGASGEAVVRVADRRAGLRECFFDLAEMQLYKGDRAGFLDLATQGCEV